MFWQGGRLVGNGVSLSIDQAYSMIPFSKEVAAACKDVLKPWKYRSLLEIREMLEKNKNSS